VHDKSFQIYVISTAPTVTFSQSTPYRINESGGTAQLGLVLSNPSSTVITIQVFNTDGTAAGKYLGKHYCMSLKLSMNREAVAFTPRN